MRKKGRVDTAKFVLTRRPQQSELNHAVHPKVRMLQRAKKEYHPHPRSSAEGETSGDKPNTPPPNFHSLDPGLTSIRYISMLCILPFLSLRNPSQTIPIPFLDQVDSAMGRNMPNPAKPLSPLPKRITKAELGLSSSPEIVSPVFHQLESSWVLDFTPSSPERSLFLASPSPAAASSCCSSALKAT